MHDHNTLLRVGGIYMISSAQWDLVTFVNGTTLEDILAALKTGGDSIHMANATKPPEDFTGSLIAAYWEEVVREAAEPDGRNRWREMKARGGFPPETHL